MQVGKAFGEKVGANMQFKLKSISVDHQFPVSNLFPRKIIKNPFEPNFKIENPTYINLVKSDIAPVKVIENPVVTGNFIKKQAINILKIRKKKIKKHRRKKWLKKYKFVIRRKEQKKLNIKEKAFAAELHETIKEAEEFDAKKYVTERLQILTREPPPKIWKGSPEEEEMMRQFFKIVKERQDHRRKIRNYRLTLDH